MPKKKKNLQKQQPLSPKKYVTTRAGYLPIYKCAINKNWREANMASITVMRKHTTRKITAGYYLVDVLALGVKDTHFRFNEPEWELLNEIQENMLEGILEEVPYALVHNIIYGAVAFAGDFDVKPHDDFSFTQYLLEDDTGRHGAYRYRICIDGKPAFIEG